VKESVANKLGFFRFSNTMSGVRGIQRQMGKQCEGSSEGRRGHYNYNAFGDKTSNKGRL